MHQDPGERSSDRTETDAGLPGSVQESGEGVGQWWTAAGLGALGAAVRAWDLLEEVTIIFITSTSGQTTGREHSPAHQQKIGLKIY